MTGLLHRQSKFFLVVCALTAALFAASAIGGAEAQAGSKKGYIVVDPF
ncbi:hypothetical protein [Paenibacillus sp.]|nr:hypothetical protein [Paenibacillus sp.]HZG55740.1 hypothetical protein [Paenibacillus sp.]